MYFTYVVRPGESPEGRGPLVQPYWEVAMLFSLRLGFLLQLVAYLGLVAVATMGSGKSLRWLAFQRVCTETTGSVPVWAVILFFGVSLMAYVCHIGFLTTADDDSSIKQSRGYHAGTKFLNQGTSLGLLSVAFTLVTYYTAQYYFSTEWHTDAVGIKASWLLYYTGRVADVLTLFMYGGSIFCLETYHSDGAGELWGWLVGGLFHWAAIAEIAALASAGTPNFDFADSAFTLLYGAALLGGSIWACMFEPISQRYDVAMSQSAMRTEYYKSRNAIAYYGPAVVNADGELDIQATGAVVQGCSGR